MPPVQQVQVQYQQPSVFDKLKMGFMMGVCMTFCLIIMRIILMIA